jgi:hypothetical protein
MRVLVKYRSMSTSLGLVRNGDIIDLQQDEVNKILLTKPLALEALPELPLEEPKKVQKAVPKKPAAKKAPAKRKRARKADGTLKADDPSTPDVNEAWEDGKHLN